MLNPFSVETNQYTAKIKFTDKQQQCYSKKENMQPFHILAVYIFSNNY